MTLGLVDAQRASCKTDFLCTLETNWKKKWAISFKLYMYHKYKYTHFKYKYTHVINKHLHEVHFRK